MNPLTPEAKEARTLRAKLRFAEIDRLEAEAKTAHPAHGVVIALRISELYAEHAKEGYDTLFAMEATRKEPDDAWARCGELTRKLCEGAKDEKP